MEEVPSHKHFEVHIDSDDWASVQIAKYIVFGLAFAIATIFGSCTLQNHDSAKYGYTTSSSTTNDAETHYNNH